MSKPTLCDGGLDLTTARIAADPGTLRDTLNHEVDTHRGYKLIDGFARYDGRHYPPRNPHARVLLVTGITGAFEAGERVRIGDHQAIVLQILESAPPTQMILRVYGLDPEITGQPDVIGQFSGAAGVFEAEDNPIPPFEIAEDAWIAHNSYVDNWRDQVAPPGSTILGVAYFRDRAWCVLQGGAIDYLLENFPDANPDESLPEIPASTLVEVFEAQPPETANYLADLLLFDVVDGDFSQGASTTHVSLNNHKVYPAHAKDSDADLEPLNLSSKIIQIYYLAEVAFVAGNQSPDVTAEITNTTGGGEALIAKLVTESGNWGSGTASGRMWLRWSGEDIETGDWEDGSGSTFTIPRIIQGNGKSYRSSSVNDFTELEGSESPYLVRDTGHGWEVFDTGHEIWFDGGQNEAENVFDKTVKQTDTSADPEAGDWQVPTDFEQLADGTSADWTTTSTGSDPSAIAAAVDTQDSEYAEQSPNTTGAKMKSGWWRKFGLDLNTLDSVVGVEVEVRLRSQGGDNPEWAEARLRLADGTESLNKAPVGTEIGTSFATVTFGSQNDNWGARLNPGNVNEDDFGIQLQFRAGTVPTLGHIEIDRIRIRLWTKPSTEHIYFYDGASDVAEADLVYYQVTHGSFDADDAEGVMTVRDLSGVVTNGLDVYTGPDGTGNFLWSTSSEAEANGLLSLEELEAEGSRYQFIEENFYAEDRLRAVYGVSGAGPAFSFSEDYFFKIRTQFDNPDRDKPRHVHKHAETRLGLGFGTGEVVYSVSGEPANIDYLIGGAHSESFGSPITGFFKLSGQSSAVLTERDIQVIQGTDPATWVHQTIAQVGAIEYTAVDMGVPIYLDTRGVSTIATSEKYGDFDRRPLSDAINSLLSPRIQRDRHGRDRELRPLVALPIRSKSQYLVFFADGLALSMTLMGDGSAQWLARRYRVNDTSLEILAAGTGVTSEGEDRVFFSHKHSPYLYELDRGYSFDGDPITGHLEFHSVWMDPAQKWKPEALMLHGLVDNFAALTVSTISDYDQEIEQNEVDLRRREEDYSQDLVPFYATTRAKHRGQTVALKLSFDPGEIPRTGYTIQAYQWVDPRPLKRS